MLSEFLNPCIQVKCLLTERMEDDEEQDEGEEGEECITRRFITADTSIYFILLEFVLPSYIYICLY